VRPLGRLVTGVGAGRQAIPYYIESIIYYTQSIMVAA